MCLYCFASLQNSVHTRLMHPCIACPSRRTDYLHFHKRRHPSTIPRPAPHLAPLPKGAGLREDSIVSNISIFSDPHNAPILQTISAARLRDRCPDYLHLHKHRRPRTIPTHKNRATIFPSPPGLIINFYSAVITSPRSSR